MTPRRRVAILGAGMAGLTTAFELTSTTELRDQYEVTIYQHGWRAGGKCASGRNAASGERIQEHGLHLWFGMYENAFSLMRRCYAELGRPANAPLATVDDAFKPNSSGILWDDYGGTWTPMALDFPPNDLLPGDGSPIPGFWQMVERGLTFSIDEHRALRDAGHAPPPAPAPDHAWVREAADKIGVDLAHLVAHGAHALLHVASALARHRVERPQSPDEEGHRSLLARLLHEFRTLAWEHEVKPHVADAKLRQWFTRFDLAATLIVGVVHDRVHDRGFEVLDDLELRAWLADHGAQPVTLAGPMVRAWYCGAFAFLGGDTSRPNVAAGMSVRGMLRQELGFKGALLYRMQAGMGDAVIAPLYETLRARGVRFELFHRVVDVVPDTSGCIGAVRLLRQAEIREGDYEPLVEVAGLPCWPTEPRWEQLVDGDALRGAGVDFELTDGPSPAPVELHVGEDFDDVVLAISVAALPPICTGLVADPKRPAFASMLEHSETVMTQGIQLWLRRSLSELGWKLGSEISSTYVEPLDTYCDMSQLIPAEVWPAAAGVHSIGYLCGVLADEPTDTEASTTERAKQAGIDFLERSASVLWPAAVREGDFDWDVLVAPDGVTGPARFDAQFWRANFPLTERYVLTPAGTPKFRLAAHESGWDNLVLAGDWTRTGLELGCVEAAVMSGMQAARAICGSPAVVQGEDHGWFVTEYRR
jgi:uncharacterized protein with NAD-binding domain and iron-sulfur cluster